MFKNQVVILRQEPTDILLTTYRYRPIICAVQLQCWTLRISHLRVVIWPIGTRRWLQGDKHPASTAMAETFWWALGSWLQDATIVPIVPLIPTVKIVRIWSDHCILMYFGRFLYKIRTWMHHWITCLDLFGDGDKLPWFHLRFWGQASPNGEWL